MLRALPLLLLIAVTSFGCAQPRESNHYAIETQLGTIVVRLYDETPLHKANFQELVAQGFYDGTLFHRTVRGFVIQGGDPNSKDGNPLNNGFGGPGHTVPGEIRPELFHKRGALAGAQGPTSGGASSGSQFYLVQGRVFTDEQLNAVERHVSGSVGRPYQFPPGHREVYKTEGGVPALDQTYTVFGEVVEGFDVLEAISRVPTPNLRGAATTPVLGDQPDDPIPMVIRPVVR